MTPLTLPLPQTPPLLLPEHRFCHYRCPLLIDCCVSLPLALFLPPLPAPTIVTAGCRRHSHRQRRQLWQRLRQKRRQRQQRRMRSFFEVMFKIFLIKSNILNIKLDKEAGIAEWDGPMDRTEAARTPHLCHGRSSAVFFVVLGILGR